MFKIFNGNITQLNQGDLQGKLYNTFNCDLTYEKGKMCISPRTILTTDSVQDALSSWQGSPVGFKYFDTKWFTVVTGGVMLNDGTPQGKFAFDTGSGRPTTTCNSGYSDLEVFGSVLLVTTTDKLFSKVTVGGTGTGGYTERRTFATPSATPSHMLCVRNDRAYWVDSRGQIFSMDTAFTTVTTTGQTYTFKVPDNHDVIFMRPHSAGIYIGTLDPNGGSGYVYDWNGVTANTWQNRYKVNAQGALAGELDDNGILHVMNSDGVLLKFTGGGFIEAGKLPVKRDLLYKATSVIINDRFIHPNGMDFIDGNLSLLINNRLNSTSEVKYRENIHSGIWEFDGVSLYHKYSPSYTTSTTITDYGQTTLESVGGLSNCSDIFETLDNKKGNFLAGAKYYINATGSSFGIWTDNYYDTLEKAGFFQTVQIRASEVKEMWQKVTTLYIPTQGFRFVVKYRTEREPHVDMNITWTGTNTFTTTQVGLSVGDEITIIQGTGSGRIAHISNVSFSTPNFTVTLDEEITGVTGTARARKENWKKIGTITSTESKFSEEGIGQPDTLVEIKVAMLGIGELTIDELVLDNAKQQ
jgi:hypothetical protein